MQLEDYVVSNSTRSKTEMLLQKSLDTAIKFKSENQVRKSTQDASTLYGLIVNELNTNPIELDQVLAEFCENILPDCTNFGSPNFMGFPDAGNSIAALCGSLLSEFLQQNLINQSFCAPSATFVEIAVIKWLREALGFETPKIESVWDVGGLITPSGTFSNTVAMMLARESKIPGTLKNGIQTPKKLKIVVPKGINHYSVKAAQRWLGCGENYVEVPVIDFRYDLEKLQQIVTEEKENIMAVIAYAGDSRTMSIENLSAVADVVRKIDSNIWLHADACHGFCLGFSPNLRHKIQGIEKFDSVATDPHKAMLLPYTISGLIVRDPNKLLSITTESDLIMKENFAFGQVIPFVGSKPWVSLKLWFMMKNFGKEGLKELVESRHRNAVRFSELLLERPCFRLVNNVDYNSVVFVYTEGTTSLDECNRVNQIIHNTVLNEGMYHIHQFSIPGPGWFKEDETLYPLRYMSGNPLVTEHHMTDMLDRIEALGRAALNA
ncbi:MAG: aspartate aminotransferase family protein [Pseudomonadales bacterium]|nr:aspartate aminotransferase family protein [Pseudomonadales bacterium]MBO6596611.1 aspartate aminotransferase family protein [Pseudomonadales bacterium]MBO6823400.1 aspartate aminotransferase family protein [Pseudomonadales bacterium]